MKDSQGKGKAVAKAESSPTLPPEGSAASIGGRVSTSASRAGGSAGLSVGGRARAGRPAVGSTGGAAEELRGFLDGIPVDVDRVIGALVAYGITSMTQLRFLQAAGRARAVIERLEGLTPMDEEGLLLAFEALGQAVEHHK